MFPSSPVVMLDGSPGVKNSVMTPAGVIRRPILPSVGSVNYTLPSGPAVILESSTFVVGSL
jgi:hypothetical protein